MKCLSDERISMEMGLFQGTQSFLFMYVFSYFLGARTLAEEPDYPPVKA
jgi:hypothetical protein